MSLHLRTSKFALLSKTSDACEDLPASAGSNSRGSISSCWVFGYLYVVGCR